MCVDPSSVKGLIHDTIALRLAHYVQGLPCSATMHSTYVSSHLASGSYVANESKTIQSPSDNQALFSGISKSARKSELLRQA